MTPQTFVGARLKAQRRLRGLSADALARRTELTVRSIEYWELGRRTPTVESLAKLAEALDCPMETFLGPAEVAS